MVKSALLLTVALASTAQTAAFLGPPGIPGVAWGAGTKLSFGFNGLGSPSDDSEKDAADEPEKKISAGGLFQLITAGMGAPFLGDYQGVDDVSYCGFASILFAYMSMHAVFSCTIFLHFLAIAGW